MIGEIPIVTFDTSAHNRLVDDPRSESILAEIKSGLWFRFAGLSVEELFASPTSRRDALFTSCRSIQRGPSECLLPSNLLTEKLILDHFNEPATFNWKTVNVRWSDCEREIRNPEFFADEPVSKDQRDLQAERRKSDKQRFVPLRSEIQPIFEAHGETPPTTFRHAISRLENVGNSAMWYSAQRLYDLVRTMDSAEATVKEFAAACPPFRSLVYAMFVPWYNLNYARKRPVSDPPDRVPARG